MSDDDFGPMPQQKPQKRKKTLLHEQVYLDQLPSADQYETSLMHRDTVNFVFVSKFDFVITTSIDGHVKFWKKAKEGIEFVKHYRAHLAVIVCADMSFDGRLFCTASVDKAVKVFDIVNFDMVNIIKLDYLPQQVCWIYETGQALALLSVSEKETSKIHLYDGRQGELGVIDKLHSQPVSIIKYNHHYNVCVSVDQGGMVEYWKPLESGYEEPKNLKFRFKSDTDLYEFKKRKTVPFTLTISPDGARFVTWAKDGKIRLFNFLTGKLLKTFDESVDVVSEMQQAGTAVLTLDDMEFGRRMAIDREIAEFSGGQALTQNIIFDESGNFIIYPTLLGIKMVNIVSNKVSRLIGKTENVRFVNLGLYQGAPKQKSIVTMEMAASENPVIKESEEIDPTLFCTGWKRNRFYLFTRRYAESKPGIGTSRDVYNEKPTKQEQSVATSQILKEAQNCVAVLHTTFGDITIKLLPEVAPKAVENFMNLSKTHYYDGVIFHRVVKGFMIQTGDPLGDGTGGVSWFGYEFEDEFHPSVRHDRAYTVSMANGGPNTNATQFFITTAPTPWLDDKHTIFGRCTDGQEVVQRIELVKTDRRDRPAEMDIRINSITLR